MQALDKALLHNGLLLSPGSRQRLNRLPLFTVLGLVAFGLAKVLVGMSRGRPVGYLLLSLVVLGVVGVVCQHRGAWVTGRGEALLQTTAAGLQVPPVGPLSARTVALTVALLGVKQLKLLGLGELVILMLPPVNVDTGSDGSSGCGGGGSGCGGGGCGGCGGCGS